MNMDQANIGGARSPNQSRGEAQSAPKPTVTPKEVQVEGGPIAEHAIKARNAVQALHGHISDLEHKLDPALSGTPPCKDSEPPPRTGESKLAHFFADIEQEAKMLAVRLGEIMARIEL